VPGIFRRALQDVEIKGTMTITNSTLHMRGISSEKRSKLASCTES
jgi:hypothetical protein